MRLPCLKQVYGSSMTLRIAAMRVFKNRILETNVFVELSESSLDDIMALPSPKFTIHASSSLKRTKHETG